MLLDTSGLLSYLHKNEPFHADAVRLFKVAAVRLTHDYVLAELVALAHASSFPRGPVLDFLVDHRVHRAAVDLLHRRADKTWSLCDAVSFVLMAERDPSEALTTDGHFEQAGCIRLLAPTP
jgi:predicted nucleic acid-binding protein